MKVDWKKDDDCQPLAVYHLLRNYPFPTTLCIAHHKALMFLGVSIRQGACKQVKDLTMVLPLEQGDTLTGLYAAFACNAMPSLERLCLTASFGDKVDIASFQQSL